MSKLDGRSRPALVSYQNGKPIGDLVALDDPGVFSTTSHNAHSSKKSAGARPKPVQPGSASGKTSKQKRKIRIFKPRS